MDNSLVIRTYHLKSIVEVSLVGGMIDLLDGHRQIFGPAIFKMFKELVEGLAGARYQE